MSNRDFLLTMLFNFRRELSWQPLTIGAPSPSLQAHQLWSFMFYLLLLIMNLHQDSQRLLLYHSSHCRGSRISQPEIDTSSLPPKNLEWE